MKLYKVVIVSLLIIMAFSLLGCAIDGNDGEHSSDVISSQSVPDKSDLEKKAEQIVEGATYAEVCSLMGSDGVDIGYGAILYEWDLQNGKRLLVWFYYPDRTETVLPNDMVVHSTRIEAVKEHSSMSECLIEEDGKQYLILPISKNKFIVEGKEAQYLDHIDFDLLKDAEKKIIEEMSQYPSPAPVFFLTFDEGNLYLGAELIVDIDPPVPTESGCDIDHEHKFWRERITK